MQLRFSCWNGHRQIITIKTMPIRDTQVKFVSRFTGLRLNMLKPFVYYILVMLISVSPDFFNISNPFIHKACLIFWYLIMDTFFFFIRTFPSKLVSKHYLISCIFLIRPCKVVFLGMILGMFSFADLSDVSIETKIISLHWRHARVLTTRIPDRSSFCSTICWG